MFSDIYRAWKSEKSNTIPQALPADFYERITMYLKGLNDELATTDPHTIQGRILATEKDMTERLLHELKEARLHKILQAAQNRITVKPADLTEEEITVINNVRHSISSIDRTGAQQNTQILDGSIVVRFLQDIPEIVGVDMKSYGPFKKEDVASLPIPNAQALIKQGAVRGIELKGIT